MKQEKKKKKNFKKSKTMHVPKKEKKIEIKLKKVEHLKISMKDLV